MNKEHENLYQTADLKKLSPRLTHLESLQYSAEELRQEALLRTDKMSIQGVQPKLSAILNVKQSAFELVDSHGQYILKPQNSLYKQLPENEDVTMRMAAMMGIEVPLHGLVLSKDGIFTYFIKRFDRMARGKKVALEDFAQLSGHDRETKYKYSMEKLIPLIDQYTTFPQLEKADLFQRVLFNFVTGNEDMHLKNFSLITRAGRTSLAPAYDLVNSTLAIRNLKEEIALSLNGKKANLQRNDFFRYYAKERLQLNDAIIMDIINRIQKAKAKWYLLLERCFLTQPLKVEYRKLLETRLNLLEL